MHENDSAQEVCVCTCAFVCACLCVYVPVCVQARTQGFEKGGYIVEKNSIEFLAINVKLFFNHARINNFIANTKPINMKHYPSVTCSLYIHKINYSKSRPVASILWGCFCNNSLQTVSTSMPA